MAVVVGDTFTGGVQGDVIAGTAPDLGAAWASDQAGIVRRGAAGVGGSVGAMMMGTNFGAGRAHVPSTIASPDYSVGGVVLWLNASGWGNKAGVRGRVAAGFLGDCYEAVYDENTEQWELAKWTGFARTALGTPWPDAYSNGPTKALRLVMAGTSLGLFVDGVLRSTATDGSITAAGYGGIYIEGGINDGLALDDFDVDDGSGGGGGAPPVVDRPRGSSRPFPFLPGSSRRR